MAKNAMQYHSRLFSQELTMTRHWFSGIIRRTFTISTLNNEGWLQAV